MGGGKKGNSGSGGNASKKKPSEGRTWTEKLLPWSLQDDMVWESPDINRTQSLYSRTDLHKCMSDFLNDACTQVGFPEYTKWSNVRLGCCVAAAALGTYSVVMLKFPKDKDMIFWAVMAYIFVATVVTFIDAWIVGPNVFYQLRDKSDKGVYCSLGMDESSPKIEWCLRSDGREDFKRQESVARYFDKQGYLVIENVFDDFCDCVEKHCGNVYIEDWRGQEESKKNK